MPPSFADRNPLPVLTVAEMRACDERTVQEQDVPAQELMEHAGQAVARLALLWSAGAQRITVVCGKGNNGGDGMVAARHLAQAGKEVSVVLLADPAQLQGEARTAHGQFPAPPRIVRDESDFSSAEMQALFARTDLFVDAILGTGSRPPLRGLALAASNAMARCAAPVLAVDLPSGWDADAMSQPAEAGMHADAVVTFTAPKPAHVFCNLTRGPVVVASIGSPDSAIQSSAGIHWTGAARWLLDRPRPVDANKGNFGHVWVVGGSLGKAGAVAMAAMAALRAGAGLVTAAVPKGILPVVASFAPEMMTFPLAEVLSGGIGLQDLGLLRNSFSSQQKAVLAIGPGLGQDPETAVFVRRLLDGATLPVALDADGLNAFAGKTGLLDGQGRTLVLTPHPGEMARLLGVSVPEVEQDRVRVARDFAQKHHLTLVLKGWRTVVAHPDGTVAINTSGTPAMAKGGSGDVLTGMIAAMLAQWPDQAATAVEAAVWLHGAAAEAAMREQEEHTLLATDILAHFSQALRRPLWHDGFIWLQEGRL